MNIYLISRPDSVDYDEYDSAVVAAETEEQARFIHPSGNIQPERDLDAQRWDGSWIAPSRVDVALIGVAGPNIQAGVICASFNAG